MSEIHVNDSDQGNFKNTGLKISDIPTLPIAYLSSSKSDIQDYGSIDLNTICLSWADFNSMFFRAPGGAFYINMTNSNAKVITFSDQKYTTIQDKNIAFSLSDQVTKFWSKKNSLAVSSIPLPTKLKLYRESFLIKSLIDGCGEFIGLSLDETIGTLLSNNQITLGNSDTSATVKFVISYKYFYEPLDVAFVVNFNYITHIPCYKNVKLISPCVYSNDYSNDSACERNCFDDNASVNSESTDTTKSSKDEETIFTTDSHSKSGEESKKW
jgi:hypothetical protein